MDGLFSQSAEAQAHALRAFEQQRRRREMRSRRQALQQLERQQYVEMERMVRVLQATSEQISIRDGNDPPASSSSEDVEELSGLSQTKTVAIVLDWCENVRESRFVGRQARQLRDHVQALVTSTKADCTKSDLPDVATISVPAIARQVEETRSSSPGGAVAPEDDREKASGSANEEQISVAEEGAPSSDASPAPRPSSPVSTTVSTSGGPRCPDCGAQIAKHSKALKKHQQNHCLRRRILCEACREVHVPFEDLVHHEQHECAVRAVRCPDCTYSVPFFDLARHRSDDCEVRPVTCKFAGCCGGGGDSSTTCWTGPARELVVHELVCSMAPVTCDHCFAAMVQHEMPHHVCAMVLAEDTCVCCSEAFGELKKRRILPAVLFDEAGGRRCMHSDFACVVCAQTWLSRGQCMQCKQSYDSVGALAEHLVIPKGELVSDGTRTKAGTVGGPVPPASEPAPREDRFIVGSVHWISPIDLRFTHDSVREKFRPFRCGGPVVYEDWSILDSARQLARCPRKSGGAGAGVSAARSVPRQLDCLDVCWHGGALYLAGTGNRRLTMWRLLALFRPTDFRRVKIQIVNKASPWVRLDQKCTTVCEGRWVEVRRDSRSGAQWAHGNKHKVLVGQRRCATSSPNGGAGTNEDPGVQWPEAEQLFEQELGQGEHVNEGFDEAS